MATSNNNDDMVPLDSPPDKQRKTIKLGRFEVSLIVANIFFAFLAIAGEVGQNVSMPLWIDSTISQPSYRQEHHRNVDDEFRAHTANHTNVTGHVAHSGDSINYANATDNSIHSGYSINSSTGSEEEYQPRVDAFFVYSFACMAFVLIFGAILLFIRLFQPHGLGETERRFPHSQLFIVGLFDAMNGMLVVFASSGRRTAPYLQAILGNFMIPLTMIFRYFILRKVPTRRKFFCAMIVLVSLFLCLIPKIFPSIDPAADRFGGAKGVAGILWPLCFMFGFIPMALMNVYEERGLKMQDSVSEQQVNIVFFLFWSSLYEMFVVLALFWTDYLPGFGYADNFYHFAENWAFGFQCVFGGMGCNWNCGVRGIVYIAMHMIGHLGAGLLMRFSEGATLLAIVQAVVTPLGFLFWTIFRESPFTFHPAVHITTWFSIAALLPMVPAIFVYNTGAEEGERSIVDPEKTPLKDLSPINSRSGGLENKGAS